ncbi:OLC1v1021938C1 [Oldenlandia corymbosa var. corymbosa]|uniref:OLC1v1021938C1 n=1 Tax=Oldenlandia corymbosa var. corymbosa TaxID=529605 RepID=A0AAV1BWS3_OLDCO|nr:OLC1v1021938C1 [Oldenlandia corymbosa var. corymbosa]
MSIPNSAQVGFLVPLKNNLEEVGRGENSVPKISLSQGHNVIGRSCITSADKRISRKHLSVNVATNGSALVSVDGTNPVVIRSKGGERKKLSSGENLKIENGDVVELIPGHYFYKYVLLDSEKEENLRSNNRKRSWVEESGCSKKDHGIVRKISEDESEIKTQAEGSKKLKMVECNGHDVVKSSEGIHHFEVSKDKLPLTFRLLRVQGLPAWANTNAVSISDVIQGNVLLAVLSNYMVDMDWLLSACPTVKKVPHVLVIHGEGDGRLEYMKRNKPANWILHKPPLPISYGTHHSKAMILVYPQGVRVIVHTANLIYVDWNNKSQGLWMQDFPWKDNNTESKRCGFETDLVDYLSSLKWPEFNANLPELGSFSINPSFFKKFDYSSAMVRLIASVPGYHSGTNLKKWGHMKLRSVLQECTFSEEFRKSPLIYQFSSLGSLDEKWMAEFAASMSAGISEDRKPLGLGEPLIVWPSVEDIRTSLEGYAAGNAVPSPVKNVEKPFLKKYWAKWKASHTGRCRAMPHIKTFLRYNGQNLAWLLLTSSNLSKAAWGSLQKGNSQLMIRSYELGVLFLPTSIKSGCGFSCTEALKSANGNSGLQNCPEEKGTKLVTLDWRGNTAANSSTEVIQLPVPYELPPKPYTPEDVPWSWDRRYTKKDVYGEAWPRHVRTYIVLWVPIVVVMYKLYYPSYSSLLRRSCYGEKWSLSLISKLQSFSSLAGVTSSLCDTNRYLRQLTKSGRLDDARKLFEQMPEKDDFTCNTMVSGYANSGRLNEAKEVFDVIPNKSSITWSSLISGYCKCGNETEIFQLFCQMQEEGHKPNQFTLGSVLRVCSVKGLLSQGKQIHGYAVRNQFDSNVYVITGLIDMYAKCLSVVEAESLFQMMPPCGRNHVTWTAMINGYSLNGDVLKTLNCFKGMIREGIKANHYTFPGALAACGAVYDLRFGEQLHCCIVCGGFESNVFVQTALLDMYAKCGDLDCAKNVLETTDIDHVVSWNSLIVGYVRNGFEEEALSLFQVMHRRNMEMDYFTYPSVINCLTSSNHVKLAQSVHCLVVKSGFNDHKLINNALLDMYAKQGNLCSAFRLFNNMVNRDVISWTSVIVGCAHNGYHEEALKLFTEMRSTVNGQTPRLWY